MQAAVYTEFGGPIRVQTMNIPVCPADGVLIRVHAVGICRSDWHGWKGHDSDIQNHGLPFIPGHEVSGQIIQMGNQFVQQSSLASSNDTTTTNTFQVGDRIAVPFILSCGTCRYCRNHQSTICTQQEQPGFTYYGGMAEYLAIPRALHHITKIPYNVSYQQAAALGCRFTTAYRAIIQQGCVVANNTIAIFGCGGLGLSCIMIAKSIGCTVIIAVDINDNALLKAKELGATHVLNTKQMNTEALQQHIIAIVNAKKTNDRHHDHDDGVDVCIEASGFITACCNAIHCTRRGGRIVQVGLIDTHTTTTSSASILPIIPMNIIAGKEIEMIGSHGFVASDMIFLLNMISENKINPALLIEQEVTLQEGAKAIEDMDHHSPIGITMITKFPNTATTSCSSCRSITSRL